jgi:hypothetical protein
MHKVGPCKPTTLQRLLLLLLPGVSATTAGLVTFICSRLLTMLRGHFGENNISQKTLVDKHFLI